MSYLAHIGHNWCITELATRPLPMSICESNRREMSVVIDMNEALQRRRIVKWNR